MLLGAPLGKGRDFVPELRGFAWLSGLRRVAAAALAGRLLGACPLSCPGFGVSKARFTSNAFSPFSSGSSGSKLKPSCEYRDVGDAGDDGGDGCDVCNGGGDDDDAVASGTSTEGVSGSSLLG